MSDTEFLTHFPKMGSFVRCCGWKGYGGSGLSVQVKRPAGSSSTARPGQRELRHGVISSSLCNVPFAPYGGWEPRSPMCWCLERALFVLEGGRLCLRSRRPVFRSPPYKLSQPRRSSHPAATWAAGTAKYFHRRVLFPCLTSPRLSVCGWDAWGAGETWCPLPVPPRDPIHRSPGSPFL